MPRDTDPRSIKERVQALRHALNIVELLADAEPEVAGRLLQDVAAIATRRFRQPPK